MVRITFSTGIVRLPCDRGKARLPVQRVSAEQTPRHALLNSSHKTRQISKTPAYRIPCPDWAKIIKPHPEYLLK